MKELIRWRDGIFPIFVDLVFSCAGYYFCYYNESIIIGTIVISTGVIAALILLCMTMISNLHKEMIKYEF